MADPSYGWLRLNTDAFRLAFEDSDFSGKYKNTINNLPTDKTFGFSYGQVARKMRVTNIRFKTRADAETVLGAIQTLQTTGTPFLLQWQVHSTGGVTDFFAFDGTTRSMLVLVDSFKGVSKAPGDSTIFFINEILFIEASKT